MIWLQAIREWLIIKLGGYVSRPVERIRIERVDCKTHKVCAMAQYTNGCPPWVIKREATKALAEEIVKMGFVKYEYSDTHEFQDERFGIVRATIMVVEVDP